MKATGVVRKLDNLGRIVIPIELRRNFGINLKDSLEIFVEGNTIVLKKYEPTCTFCGESKDIFTFEGKNICHKCAEKIQALAK